MAKVSLKHIYKVYDGKVKAVNDFNLEIEDKEFVVFVGPSGCGKSTTLRMVAGLEEITAGELRIGDRICNHVEPKDRNIAMVFQNYALFPNMTVYDNIAFGLKMHKVPKAEIDKKVHEAAEILGITEYLDRKPKALSGGQRQRVALGRAIVREPNVFLLDEPLSNLDAKLRARMRTEITRLHKRLQATFIYVTHDQVEAMTMGDRIVVMKGGFVQQIGTPQELFNFPVNKFVAGFLGTPQMNFFDCTLLKESDGSVTVRADGFTLSIPEEETYRLDASVLDGAHKVTLGIRPDDITPLKGEAKGAEIEATVSLVEELGVQTLIYCDTDANSLMIENSPTAFCSSTVEPTAIKAGEKTKFRVNISKLHFFDVETETTLKERVPTVKAQCRVEGGEAKLLGGSVVCPGLFSRIESGTYTVSISPAALSFGNGFKGVIEAVEQQGREYVYRVRLGDDRVFLKSDEKHETGEETEIALALDSVGFYDNGTPVMEPIPEAYRFDGTFAKLKVKEGGKTVKRHFALIAGGKLCLPDEFTQKMYDQGRGIFKKELSYEVSLDDITATSMSDTAPMGEGEGLVAAVEDVLDYGYVKYLKLKLEGKPFCVKWVGDAVPPEVSVSFDFDNVRVYDKAIDMKLF